MKKILSYVLVATAALVSAITASPSFAGSDVAQNTAQRAYLVDFSGDGQKSFVYLDRKAGTVLVCEEENVDSCRNFDERASDLIVIPAPQGLGEQLLLIDALGNSKACNLRNAEATLECRAELICCRRTR